MKVLDFFKKHIPNFDARDIDDFFRVDIISGDLEDYNETDDYSHEELDFMSFNKVQEMGQNQLSVFTGKLKVTIKSANPNLKRNLRAQVLLKFLWEESDELLEAFYEEYDHFYGEGGLNLTKTRTENKTIQGQSTVYVISTELSAEKWEQVLPDGPDY